MYIVNKVKVNIVDINKVLKCLPSGNFGRYWFPEL